MFEECLQKKIWLFELFYLKSDHALLSFKHFLSQINAHMLISRTPNEITIYVNKMVGFFNSLIFNP